MPVESAIRMEQEQQQCGGMQVCSAHPALSGSAAAAWMQSGPGAGDYQHQQQHQQHVMAHVYDSHQAAADAAAALQHPGALELHPGAAAADSLTHLMPGGVQQHQQHHPASVGGLPGTLLAPGQAGTGLLEADVLMHPAAALPDDGVDPAAAAAAVAAGGVNGLLMHTISTGGPDLVPHPGAAAAAAGGGGAGGLHGASGLMQCDAGGLMLGDAAGGGAGGGNWPQPSQSQSSSVGLDASNMEQQAHTHHQHDQRQQSGLRSSGANTGSNAGGNRKQ